MSENQQNEKTGEGKGRGKFPKKPQFPKGNFNFYWIYAIIIVLLIGAQIFGISSGSLQPIIQKEFELMMKDHHISKIVVINKEYAEIHIKKEHLDEPRHKKVSTRSIGGGVNTGPHYRFNFNTLQNFELKLEELQKEFPSNERIYLEAENRINWMDQLGWILPILFMIVIWIFIMRRMGGGAPGSQIFNIGKSKATLFDKEANVNITFNDVAGLESAKVEIKEIVDFLKNSKKYTELGAKIPKGALLVGPPGTGKTLLAKAVAGEAKVPFFSLSGSDFVEMFVGVGASRVRDLFRQAKEKAPCIVFIDEIDAIGRARGRSVSHGANDERENTLNQLLTEMDGFGTNSGVIILAATNRADILDRALLRPGRFDRQIYVDMPDLVERKEIFKVHLKPLKLDPSVDIDFLAKQTPGFSGADIANICNEAALIAARKNKKIVDRQDFLDAVDRIIGGLEKKNKIISAEEKKVIAYHEAGHATISWLLEHASPLVKVTIVPRGRSLGAAWYLPEERQITTTEQLFEEICATLGGRAAEEIIFGKISTGALNDLERITKQAYAMVMFYGLNPRIGNISYYDSTGGGEYSFNKPYSEDTAKAIDEEVSKLIDKAYRHTKELLTKSKHQLTQLAELLLEKEVIFKEDLEKIFGKRLFDKDVAKEAEALAEEAKKAAGTTNGSSAATPVIEKPAAGENAIKQSPLQPDTTPTPAPGA